MNTFTRKTKQFQASNKSDISESCEAKNYAIIELVCKLTLLNSKLTHNHWKNNLCGIFIVGSRCNLKHKQKFDYNWFFDRYGQVDLELAESVYNSLPSKYDSVKIDNPDFQKLSDNCDNLRLLISQKYAIKKSILNKIELMEIIEQLDLFE